MIEISAARSSAAVNAGGASDLDSCMTPPSGGEQMVAAAGGGVEKGSGTAGTRRRAADLLVTAVDDVMVFFLAPLFALLGPVAPSLRFLVFFFGVEFGVVFGVRPSAVKSARIFFLPSRADFLGCCIST
jgi:hypothetical protein